MPFIDLGSDFDESTEAKHAPAGMYDLECVKMDDLGLKPVDDDGVVKHNWRAMLAIRGTDEEYAPIFTYIPMLTETDDDEKRKNKILIGKRFAVLFGIQQPKGFDPEDALGKEARAELKVGVYNNQPKNEIVVPRLPDATDEAEGKGQRRRR